MYPPCDTTTLKPGSRKSCGLKGNLRQIFMTGRFLELVQTQAVFNTKMPVTDCLVIQDLQQPIVRQPYFDSKDLLGVNLWMVYE